MTNGYKIGLAAIAASLALVGCGGGSSSDDPATVSGNLFNTYVEGATYVCSSGKTGTTDNMGTYTCNVGDTVEFFLGKFSIGSTDAAEGILDTDLLSPNDDADVDLLQLLQGIDDESDGVITIPEDFTDLDALVDLNVSLGDPDFETVISAETNITLESEKDAVDNHAENLIQVYLGGKTFYMAAEDDFVQKLVFDTNLTEVNSTIIAGLEAGTSDLLGTTLENGWLSIAGLGHIEFVEATDDYLLINHTMDTVTVEEKYYFDAAQANAVYEGYILITEEKLSAQTFYFTEEEYDNGDSQPKTGDLYTKLTFANGTVTINDIWESATNDETDAWTGTAPYEILEGKLRVDVSGFLEEGDDPEGYLWFTLMEENPEYWYFSTEEDIDKDGEIDYPSENETWYLEKPVGFPAAL